MQTCKYCQAENSDLAKFCKKCGENLLIVICPNCKEENSSDSIFCQNCGKRIIYNHSKEVETVSEPPTEKELSASIQQTEEGSLSPVHQNINCPNCGLENSKDLQNCFKCGAYLHKPSAYKVFSSSKEDEIKNGSNKNKSERLGEHQNLGTQINGSISKKNDLPQKKPRKTWVNAMIFGAGASILLFALNWNQNGYAEWPNLIVNFAFYGLIYLGISAIGRRIIKNLDKPK